MQKGVGVVKRDARSWLSTPRAPIPQPTLKISKLIATEIRMQGKVCLRVSGGPENVERLAQAESSFHQPNNFV